MNRRGFVKLLAGALVGLGLKSAARAENLPSREGQIVPQQFTVFTASNRQANVVYNSGAYTVPEGAQMVKLTLDTLDIVGEPDTTVFYWVIEKAPSDAGPFTHMVGGSVRGQNGVEPPKPINTIACSVNGVIGWSIRGHLYFVSENDTRKRFGVDGLVY